MQSKTLTSNEKTVLKRRNLNPADYTVEKRLNYCLILRNRNTGSTKMGRQWLLVPSETNAKPE